MEDGQYKFSNCSFRSLTEHISIDQGCCWRREKKGFLCTNPAILIDDVKPEICEPCIYYIKKEEE